MFLLSGGVGLEAKETWSSVKMRAGSRGAADMRTVAGSSGGSCQRRTFDLFPTTKHEGGVEFWDT